jgi:hypothetical protein
MRFDLRDTDRPPAAKRRDPGPVYNGITPATFIIVDNTTDALEFIDYHIGSSWAEWSLWWLMPENELMKCYYALLPIFLPDSTKKVGRRGEVKHTAQLLCGRTRDGGFFDAKVKL